MPGGTRARDHGTTGSQLDRAVALALGYTLLSPIVVAHLSAATTRYCVMHPSGLFRYVQADAVWHQVPFRPSTSLVDAWTVVESGLIKNFLLYRRKDGTYTVQWGDWRTRVQGETAMVAICRAVVQCGNGAHR